MSKPGEMAVVALRRDRREKLVIAPLDVFREWCAARNVSSMVAAPETVRLFLRDLLPQVGEERTLEHLRAVRRVHLINGEPDPTQGAWDDDEDFDYRAKRRLVKRDESPSKIENT